MNIINRWSFMNTEYICAVIWEIWLSLVSLLQLEICEMFVLCVFLWKSVISASRWILLRLPDDLLMFFGISDFKPAAWWKSHTCIWALCHNCWSLMMRFLLRRVSVTKTSSGFICPSLSQTPVFYLNNTAPPGLCSAVHLCFFVCLWVYMPSVLEHCKGTI